MKYGIISDIHGNVIALRKILKKFEELYVDKIICCGDIIGIGPDPENAVQELIKLGNKLICVRGNHEGYLIDGLPERVHDDKRMLSETEKKCHLWQQEQLSNNSIGFLKNLSSIEYILDGNIRICIIHYPISFDGKHLRHLKNPTLEECENLFERL